MPIYQRSALHFRHEAMIRTSTDLSLRCPMCGSITGFSTHPPSYGVESQSILDNPYFGHHHQEEACCCCTALIAPYSGMSAVPSFSTPKEQSSLMNLKRLAHMGAFVVLAAASAVQAHATTFDWMGQTWDVLGPGTASTDGNGCAVLTRSSGT